MEISTEKIKEILASALKQGESKWNVGMITDFSAVKDTVEYIENRLNIKPELPPKQLEDYTAVTSINFGNVKFSVKHLLSSPKPGTIATGMTLSIMTVDSKIEVQVSDVKSFEGLKDFFEMVSKEIENRLFQNKIQTEHEQIGSEIYTKTN